MRLVRGGGVPRAAEGACDDGRGLVHREYVHARRSAQCGTAAFGAGRLRSALRDGDVPAAAVRVGDGHLPQRSHGSQRHALRADDTQHPCVIDSRRRAHGELGGLPGPLPRRVPAAPVGGDPAGPYRVEGAPDVRGVGTAVRVPVGQDEERGGEAVAAEVGDLPDAVLSGRGEVGGERPAQEGAAAVALAIGADEGERRALVGRAEAAVITRSEGYEVEGEQGLRGLGHGAAQPGVPRNGVGHIHMAPGGGMEVGVPARAPDEGDAHAGPLRGRLQGPAELRVQMAGRQRLHTPGARLLDQQPGTRGGGGPRERLVQVLRGGRTRTHVGEPNLTCPAVGRRARATAEAGAVPRIGRSAASAAGARRTPPGRARSSPPSGPPRIRSRRPLRACRTRR